MKINQAIDMYNGNVHNYPPLKEDIPKLLKRLDFIFTKNGKWYYNSSTDDENILETIKAHELIEENNEKWALINNLTGEILKHN